MYWQINVITGGVGLVLLVALIFVWRTVSPECISVVFIPCIQYEKYICNANEKQYIFFFYYLHLGIHNEELCALI